MRSEKEVYDIVLNFAKTDKRIRMVTLEGSRTNTNYLPAFAESTFRQIYLAIYHHL